MEKKTLISLRKPIVILGKAKIKTVPSSKVQSRLMSPMQFSEKKEIKELLGKCREVIEDFKSKNKEQGKMDRDFQIHIGGIMKQ